MGQRRCDDHAEKTKSVAEPVISRGQFLAILVERCPHRLQSVFDLFCFLLLERDFLSKISRTVSLRQDLDFDVADRDLFCFHFVLVTEYLRSVRVNSQTHCIRAGLELT